MRRQSIRRGVSHGDKLPAPVKNQFHRRLNHQPSSMFATIISLHHMSSMWISTSWSFPSPHLQRCGFPPPEASLLPITNAFIVLLHRIFIVILSMLSSSFSTDVSLHLPVFISYKIITTHCNEVLHTSPIIQIILTTSISSMSLQKQWNTTFVLGGNPQWIVSFETSIGKPSHPSRFKPACTQQICLFHVSWLGLMHRISWIFWAPRGGLRCDASRLCIVKKSLDLCATSAGKTLESRKLAPVSLYLHRRGSHPWGPPWKRRTSCGRMFEPIPQTGKARILIWHWYPFTARVDNPQSY